MMRKLAALPGQMREWLVSRHRARPFGRNDRVHALVLYEPRRISLAQVFPYMRFAPSFRDRHGVELRFMPNTALENATADRPGRPDIVLLQAWFDWDGDRLARAFDAIRRLNPDARIVFLDPIAPSDLRMAHHVEPHVTFYLKKALFRDTSLYFRAFRGDTNLTEFYGDRYGLAAAPTDWRTPEAILPKLLLSPGFFTAPDLMPLYDRRRPPPPLTGRRLDVHARMEAAGGGWYGRMRQESLGALNDAPGIHVTATARVPWPAFMDELRSARLCFSCFGFGELCWRDSEAQAAGTVLVKQDMSHLRTRPDIYEPGETYVPVRWDFADLPDVIAGLLADPDRQAQLATTAFERIASYLAEERFVDDMAILFR